MQKNRLRIRFTKSGDLRWISHRDLARVWERLLRRANLSLAFSEGFHPKPKISFPSALALGIEAFEEVVELELEGAFDLANVEARIRASLVEGMELLSMRTMPPGSRKAQIVASRFRMELPDGKRAQVLERIAEIGAQPTLEVRRDGKSVVVRTRDPYFKVEIDGGWLHFTLPATLQGSLRPSELLESLGLRDLVEQGGLLQRVELILDDARGGTVGAEASCAGPAIDDALEPD